MSTLICLSVRLFVFIRSLHLNDDDDDDDDDINDEVGKFHGGRKRIKKLLEFEHA